MMGKFRGFDRFGVLSGFLGFLWLDVYGSKEKQRGPQVDGSMFPSTKQCLGVSSSFDPRPDESVCFRKPLGEEGLPHRLHLINLFDINPILE